MILHIGSKNLSSWSLRPWLLMKHFEIPFQENLIELDQASSRTQIEAVSPSGRVPVLDDSGFLVWDSLAIVEYLHEKFPDRGLWPEDFQQRARARCIVAEMHSGFTALRTHLPHNLMESFPGHDLSKAQDDIDRVQKIWNDCLQSSSGPYLFGAFSIADAFFAPVANRFVTYHVPISGAIKGYVEILREHSHHKNWIQSAK